MKKHHNWEASALIFNCQASAHEFLAALAKCLETLMGPERDLEHIAPYIKVLTDHVEGRSGAMNESSLIAAVSMLKRMPSKKKWPDSDTITSLATCYQALMQRTYEQMTVTMQFNELFNSGSLMKML